MAIALSGTPILSNSGGSTATSMTATLASTTVGALNIIAVSANTTGPGVDPAQTVAGFTAVLGSSGTSGKTGTPYHRLSLFYRFFQSGDTNPTVTIAALGNIECAAVAYTGVDTTTPFVTGEVLAQPQGASSTSWSTGSITTAALRWIISVFGNRTNGTWSALTDTQRLTGIVASSANIAYEDTNGTVAAGTITARTATFSTATSVGNTVIVALNPAGGTAATGTAALTLTASGTAQTPATATAALALVATGSGAAPATASASLDLSATGGGPTSSGTATLTLTATGTAPTAAAAGSAALSLTATGTGRAPATGAASLTLTATGTTVTLLATWLSHTPLYVAHRGGDNDWVEMTRDAYTNAIANGSASVNIDAVKCSTGEFVASHDLTTGRVFGTNYTIASTSWSTLSSLTTTTGGFPIEKVSDLLAAFPNVVVFVENKGNSSDDTALLDMLDAAGGKARIVIKQYYTASTVSTDAHARSYTTWGYYYGADLTNLAATHSRWDLLGLDYLDTNSAHWTDIKSYGKPVLGHVIPSAAAAAQAFSEGADGIMTGKVLGVIPNNAATGTASLSLTASGAGKAAATASAALSLTSTGTVQVSGTASASLSLAAAGAASATPTATASLTLTANGAATGPATGSAALSLTGAGTEAAASAGTAALTLGASAAATTTAAGTAQLTLTGDGVTAAPIIGTANLDLTGGGAGQAPAAGAASLTFTASGVTGGGSPAAGSADLTLTAAASATAAAGGSAIIALTGTATYTAAVAGGAVITITATAAPAAAATSMATLELTATASVTSGEQDIIFTAALQPQTWRLTAALAPQSYRFTASLGGQP